VINPTNQIHVYSHAVNQAVYDPVRIRTKGDDLLTAEGKPKQIKGHGVWLMQNPKLHFHRHYLLVVNHDRTSYKLVPVKQRQQFAIGFWHSIGVSLENIEQVRIEGGDEISGSTVTAKQQAILVPVTTSMVLKQIKAVQAYQNFSASQAYRILKRRAKIDENYEYWITGSTNPMIFFVLIGGVCAIALMMFFLHGNSPAGPASPTGPKSMFGI
ncbi:MAG: hypothetical protein KGN01_08240, partial [Patescibacteria group bacterium]|nr:hypothetical protein [Patescibacteria group bacterium]